MCDYYTSIRPRQISGMQLGVQSLLSENVAGCHLSFVETCSTRNVECLSK